MGFLCTCPFDKLLTKIIILITMIWGNTRKKKACPENARKKKAIPQSVHVPGLWAISLFGGGVWEETDPRFSNTLMSLSFPSLSSKSKYIKSFLLKEKERRNLDIESIWLKYFEISQEIYINLWYVIVMSYL